jgi:hypothetical protein
MKPNPRVERIPWQTIGLVLAGTAIVAWGAGFVMGLIVRFAFGAW